MCAELIHIRLSIPTSCVAYECYTSLTIPIAVMCTSSAFFKEYNQRQRYLYLRRETTCLPLTRCDYYHVLSASIF